MRRFAAFLTFAVLAVAPATAAAQENHEHSGNMTHVKNLPYAPDNGGTPNYGTDIEFATIAGNRYALAGSYKNGLQITDVTRPAQAEIVSVYDCGVTQGDVQVFRQPDLPGRTFVTYTSDTFGDGTSTCYQEAQALGFDVLKPGGTGKNGTFIAEITDPLNPRTISFVDVPQGSHNMTVHPSGNYLYNSNSDLITSVAPAIEIFDISDPASPALVGELDLPPRPGLGTESHDITFSDDGQRAYSAALSQGVIIDTRDPANPAIVSSFLDPAINVWHQMDPFTMTDELGREREFVIAEDEFVGAVGTGQCPNGGVHVYETTGGLERNPQKVGYWNIDTVDTTDQVDGRCTAHVFDIHEDEQIMTIAYYNGGVHVVDLSGLAGVSLADQQLVGAGMKEIGYYRIEGGESWAAKTPRISSSGDFHLYSNDIERGLDIFKFTAAGQASTRQGQWMSPAEARDYLSGLPKVPVTRDNALVCLLPES
jgi:LVIVD repeat